jgi:hypothetical protein
MAPASISPGWSKPGDPVVVAMDAVSTTVLECAAVPTGSGETNEHDVEIEKARAKYSVWMRLCDGVVALCTFGSVALPILILGVFVVEPLAGKTTDADINISIGVTVTLSVSVGINVVQWLKGKERKRTIRDQRARMNRYEETLGLPRTEERRLLGRRTL